MRLLFMLFALLIGKCAKAQEYLPLLTEGKVWHCVWKINGSFVSDGVWPYTVIVSGDSLINDKTYKRLIAEFTDSVPRISGWTKQMCYTAYEENKCVYIYDEYNKYGGDEKILDFNLHKGDVAREYGNVVKEEDYVDAYGVIRKRLNIDADAIWVEGVGCNTDWGFIPNKEVPFDIELYLLDCYENGKLIFTKDDFNKVSTGVKQIYSSCDEKETMLYDLSGKPLQKPSRGVYIKKDHKVLQRN